MSVVKVLYLLTAKYKKHYFNIFTSQAASYLTPMFLER